MYTEDLALNNLQWLICHKTYNRKVDNITIYTKMAVEVVEFSYILLY